jgi:thiamine monophosphate synthase
VGLSRIAQVRSRCRLPIVAIGGITAENARRVREAGADAAAVISAVAAADDIARAARELKLRLEGGAGGAER